MPQTFRTSSTPPLFLSAQLVVLTAVAALTAPLPAQTPPTASAEIHHTGAVVDLDLPTAPLAQSLNALAQQGGAQIIYASALTEGLQAPTLQGRYSMGEALRALLAGTGLQARTSAPHTYTITARSPSAGALSHTLPEVTVLPANAAGYAGGSVATRSNAATKTDTPLLELPQTVNVITRAQIETQGAQSVTEAARYTPGVIATFGDSDSRNDVLQSRGFYTRYDFNGSRLPYGAYSTAFLRIEPYGLERIDILKGPASVLYGQNLPGGLVSLTSKLPTAEPLREVLVQMGSHQRKQAAFDLASPLANGSPWRYRLTGLVRDADGRVDSGFDQRKFLAPALTWAPNARTDLTLLGHYQKDDTLTDYVPLPAEGTLLPNPNGRLPTSRNSGEPDFDDYERRQSSIGYLFRHEFDNAWTLQNKLQRNHVKVDAKASPGYLLDTSQRLLSRVASNGVAEAESLSLVTQLSGHLNTGAVMHKLLVGVDHLRLDDRYRFASGLYEHPLDLYAPEHGAQTPALVPRIDYHMKRRQSGLYLQDQLYWENWVVTAGLRNDWVKANSLETHASSRFDAHDSALSGRLGVNYLFDNGVAPYASYSTSFDPVDGVSPTGGALKPLKGRQIELGVKYQPAGSDSMLTLALYQTHQQNVTAPNPVAGGIGLLQAGEARVNGVELEAKSRLGKHARLTASYAYTDSVVTKANDGAEYLLDKQLVMTPDHQASLWLEHRLSSPVLAGLGVAGGLRYQGKSYGDALNQFEVGGHTLVDLALNYDFGARYAALRGLNLQFNASNLLDKEYVGYCQSALACYYGQGRTMSLTLKYRW